MAEHTAVNGGYVGSIPTVPALYIYINIWYNIEVRRTSSVVERGLCNPVIGVRFLGPAH